MLDVIEAAADWTTVQKCGYVLALSLARSGHDGLDLRITKALVPGLASQRSRVRDSVTHSLRQLDPGFDRLTQTEAIARARLLWPEAALDPAAPPPWLREHVVLFRPVPVAEEAPTRWQWEGQSGSLAQGAAWLAEAAATAQGRSRIALVIQLPWERVHEPWVDAASAVLGEHADGWTVSPMADVFLPVWPPLAEAWPATPGPAGVAPTAELARYVDFLAQEHQAPKDYILGLFEDHDIVVLCERMHAETTQYELISDLVSDPRFVERVGMVFTEIGTSSVNDELHDLMGTPDLTEQERDRRILQLYRDLSFQVYWGKYTFFSFLQRAYEAGRRLSEENRVELHFSDMPFVWEGMTAEKYEAFRRTLGSRDRVMAQQIEVGSRQVVHEASAGTASLRSPRAGNRAREVQSAGTPERTRELPRVLGDPRPELLVVEFAPGERQHGAHLIDLVRIEPATVERQEHRDREHRNALVAVHERVVLREAEAVGCCEAGQLRVRLVAEAVARASACSLQQPRIADPGQSTEQRQGLVMQRHHHRPAQPSGLHHQASSRSWKLSEWVPRIARRSSAPRDARLW